MFDINRQLDHHRTAYRILNTPAIQALIELGNADQYTWTWHLENGQLNGFVHRGFIRDPDPELYTFARNCDDDSWYVEMTVFNDTIEDIPVTLTIKGWIRYDADDWELLRKMGFVQETLEPARIATAVVCHT